MKKESFTCVKDKITYILENSLVAKMIGDEAVYEPYLDMIKTFWICKDASHNVRVSCEDLKRWDVDLQTISKAADKNSPILYPPMIQGIQITLKGLKYIELGDTMEAVFEYMEHIDEIIAPMFVLTTVRQAYGASSILYPQLIEEISKRWQDDVTLLPSSQHEFLLIPSKKNDKELWELQEMVSFMNTTEYVCECVLSDSVYIYDRKQGKIVIGISN